MKRAFILSAAILIAVLSVYARQPERGYRGFAEWTNRITHHTYSYTFEGEKYSWSSTYYNPGISTSHGYQFNPWLFAGAGIDYSLKDSGKWHYNAPSHSYDLQSYFLSIFGQVRTDLQFGKFTPFADIRLGWNATSNGTVYFSPSVGYRFNWGRKVGLNVGIGYTLDGYRYEKWIPGITTEGLQIYVPTGEFFNQNLSYFTFRIGIDF